MTPTAGAGPGFGPVVAVLALLASALVVIRRR
jgi:PGF-CTERM protein